jgi:hypothetical protein
MLEDRLAFNGQKIRMHDIEQQEMQQKREGNGCGYEDEILRTRSNFSVIYGPN